MSLRRFNGWEPKRTTTVTEWENGRPKTWVTVTEPEFDANERDDWYAMAEYQNALCPSCGRLRSLCENPDVDWYPQMHVCWASAAQSVASRRWHKKHEDAKPDAAGYLPTDGGFVWVSTEDLTPDDDFLN